MNARLWTLLVAAALFASAPNAPCRADAAQVAAGSIELTPNVTFSHSNFKREGYGNVQTVTQLEVTPTVGYCLSNHYEVTGGFITRHTSIDGSSDTNLGATAGLTYNFSSKSNVVPFASAGFGTLFYGGFGFDRTSVLAPILTGGLRLMIGSSASANLTLSFQHESNAQGDFNATANRLIAGVGVSIFPWHAR